MNAMPEPDRPKRDFTQLNATELEREFWNGELDLIQFITYARLHVRKYKPEIQGAQLDRVVVDMIRGFKK